MGYDIVSLHKLIDTWAAEQRAKETSVEETPTITGDATIEMEPVRELPEGKRVVRTKNTGDRVYLIDEVKKTKQWLTNPEVLKASGFEMGDITEIEENEFLKYQQGPAIYRVEDASS